MVGDLPSPIRTLQDVMDVIHAIESRYPVDRWRVGELDVWPIARIQMGFALFRAIEGADARRPSAVPQRLVRRIRSLPSTLPAGLERTPQLRRSVPAVFLADGVSFVATPDGMYDRHCDPLRVALAEREMRSLLLLPEPTRDLAVPPARSVRFRLDLAFARGRLRKTPRVELPAFDGAQADLRRAGHLTALPARGAFVRRATDVIAMAASLEQLLVSVGARLAVVSEYYSGTGMAFVLAARRAGAVSVDVQHGVQGPLHFAYSRWSRLPSAGSAVLPDRFWVWSSTESQVIADWAPEGQRRSIVGGNAFLEASIEGAVPGSEPANQAVVELMQRHEADRLVLVALSGREPDEFIDQIMQVVARAGRGWLWAVRSHPTSPDAERWAAQAQAREANTVETQLSSSLPLFALLSKADAVVSRFSSVTIDAAAMGVPSVVVDPLGAELFADQIHSGATLVATSGVDSIVDAVERCRAFSRSRPPRQRSGEAVDELLRLAGGVR